MTFPTILPSHDDERTIQRALRSNMFVVLADRTFYIDRAAEIAGHTTLRLIIDGARLVQPTFEQRRRILTRRRIELRRLRARRVVPRWYPLEEEHHRALADECVLKFPPPHLFPAEPPWQAHDIAPGEVLRLEFNGRVRWLQIVEPTASLILEYINVQNDVYLEKPVRLAAVVNEARPDLDLFNLENVAVGLRNPSATAPVPVRVRALGYPS